jgi:hypothetical protein
MVLLGLYTAAPHVHHGPKYLISSARCAPVASVRNAEPVLQQTQAPQHVHMGQQVQEEPVDT